ncbi:S8 family serine peptidase [Streptomyces sp. NPDC047022]|uniref:S8 family serine peptidase n=1 Tax=Streptomyces sp. NPDC047022 TaxID=3155737 RepID=UPI0033DD3E5C
MATALSALGAMVALSVGLPPTASADDVQSQQWYLSAMKADQMWKVSTGEGVKVAVIDTGVNPSTPSLKGQVLTSDVPSSVSYAATKDYVGHGTSMSEMIAGTGADGGLKGLAPGAKIVPFRGTTKGLSKAEEKKTPSLAAIIRAAADTDAKIISMSIGSESSSPEEEAAVKYAHSKGKLMFAATGNDAATEKQTVLYPAAYPYVVGVAASDKTGTVGKFSQYGSAVDLAAPGLDLPTWCDAKFTSYCPHTQGTSSATAIASASAALIWSAHPDWTANQVLRSLIDTAGRSWPKDHPSNYLGYGLVRPRMVLQNGSYNPGPAGTDPLAKEDALDPEGSPSTSASATSQPSKTTADGGTSAAGSSAKSSGSSTTWVAVGAAAAVLVIGGVAFVVVRSRRRA